MINDLHIIEKWMLRKINKFIAKSKKLNYIKYKKGEKLKILIIGYSGKKNIGAEVRCSEIIKQIKTFNLPIPVEFGVLTLNPNASRSFYTSDVKLIRISSIFFKDLLLSCSEYHMGILAEGSCLTTATSNVAALFFICAAGMMKAQNKLCIGYGVEGGSMPNKIFREASIHCSDTYFIARTNNSKRIFDQLGISNNLGTDTAWTVDALSDEWAQNELQTRFGVDMSSTLVGISPMNPFIRPIYPSISRYIKGKLTNNWHGHYDKIYFYTITKKRDQLYKNYLQAIHAAIESIRKVSQRQITALYIVMEPMDYTAVNDLCRITDKNNIILSANDYNGVEMTAMLRQLSLLITSRYHAHVLSIPAGVPCIAISKDSRLTDIFSYNGLTDYCISTQDEFLPTKLPSMATSAYLNRIAIREVLLNKFPEYLQIQNKMGEYLKQKIINYIEFNVYQGI